MSTHCYPFGGYGLYLDEDDARSFVGAYSDRYFDGGADEIDVMSHIDGQRLAFDEPIDGWTVRTLDGRDAIGGEYAKGIFLYGPKAGTCLADDNDGLYANAMEMAGELFAMYGDCLPDDFDYVAHLAEVQGTTEG